MLQFAVVSDAVVAVVNAVVSDSEVLVVKCFNYIGE